MRISFKISLIGLILILILGGCQDTTKVKSYIKRLNSAQVNTIYTNDLKDYAKKLRHYDVKAVPADLSLIEPYNTVLVLKDTAISRDRIQKLYPFAKTVNYKSTTIIDNTLSGLDMMTFMQKYATKLNLPQLVYTNKVDALRKYVKKVALLPKKCAGNPCKPNANYQRQMSSINSRIEAGLAFGVYFFDTDTSVYSSADEIIKSFPSCNIVGLRDGYIILPVFTFSSAMLDTMRSILSSDTNAIIIYTDKYFMKNYIPKGKRRSWLPRKYIKTKKNIAYVRQMNGVNKNLERDQGIVVYFYNRFDTIFPSVQDLHRFFSNHIFYYFPQGILVRSRYYKMPSIIDSVINRIKRDPLVKRIYTNKVYFLKSFLKRYDINISIIWEPHVCVLKDTICYPKKDFNSRMYHYKLDVDARRALWVHFKDPTQKIFPKEKFLKSYLAIDFDTETDDGILFSSPYRNSPTLKALKEKIIPLYYNPEFKIYSNKVYILQRLLDTSYQYIHLPVQFLLPSYERNERLDGQLLGVKQDIIVNNSIVVYLRDPTDSLHPSESYIREKFKYFKFYNFKDGFVIGHYLGD